MRSVEYYLKDEHTIFNFRTSKEVHEWAASLIQHEYDCAMDIDGAMTSARELLLKELNKFNEKGLKSLEQIIKYCESMKQKSNTKAMRERLGVMASNLKIAASFDPDSPNGWYHLKNQIEKDYKEEPKWCLQTIHRVKGREGKYCVGIGTAESTPSTRALRLGGTWLTQEYKLLFVHATRGKLGLIEMVPLSEMEWPSDGLQDVDNEDLAPKGRRLQQLLTKVHTRSANSSQEEIEVNERQYDANDALAVLGLTTMPPNLHCTTRLYNLHCTGKRSR